MTDIQRYYIRPSLIVTATKAEGGRLKRSSRGAVPCHLAVIFDDPGTEPWRIAKKPDNHPQNRRRNSNNFGEQIGKHIMEISCLVLKLLSLLMEQLSKHGGKN